MSSAASKWVLALDISSSGVGYAVGAKGALLKYGKYIPKKKGGRGQQLLNFSKWLSKLIHNLPRKPHQAVIESPYYNRNVKTYGVLSKHVGAAEREIFRLLGIEPDFIASSTVKKIIKVPKGKTHYDRKRNMVKKINKMYGLDLKYHRSNKKKSDDDTADSIALLHAWFDINDVS